MNKPIYKCIVGSKLYGTDVKDSDTDYLEVLCESKEQLLGIEANESLPQKVTEKVDENYHWLKNYIKYCSRCNPNTLESLYAQGNKVIEVGPDFSSFIFYRKHFLSLNCLRKSHFGFANSQIAKMEIYAPDRGAARKELIDKYGYDLKYAAHALRLIWQLESFVKEHEVIFPYAEPICDSLRNIKLGNVSKTNFLTLYNSEVKRIEAVVELNKYNLPLDPNIGKINELLIGFYERHFGFTE